MYVWPYVEIGSQGAWHLLNKDTYSIDFYDRKSLEFNYVSLPPTLIWRYPPPLQPDWPLLKTRFLQMAHYVYV